MRVIPVGPLASLFNEGTSPPERLA